MGMEHNGTLQDKRDGLDRDIDCTSDVTSWYQCLGLDKPQGNRAASLGHTR